MPHVPPRFREIEPSDVQDATMRAVVERYLRDFWEAQELGRAPAFIGRTGCGKTTAAAAVAKRVWEVAQLDVEFVAVPEVVPVFDLQRFSAEVQAMVFRQQTVAFLVLDDCDVVTSSSATVQQIFASVIAARYAARRPTLWTGNFDLPAGREWPVLYQQFGPMVARRLEHGSEGYRIIIT
jgi:DNA replication protein DnaC